MEVVVDDKQLSLAIGKKGQNVRLAAKLLGWKIDIKSEEEKRQEVEAEMARMARAADEIRSLERHGVSDKIVQKLVEAGIHGLAHLAEMPDDELLGLEGVGPKTVEKVREAAAQARQEWDERDAAEEAEKGPPRSRHRPTRTPPTAAAAAEASAAVAPLAAPAAEGTSAGQSGEEAGSDGER